MSVFHWGEYSATKVQTVPKTQCLQILLELHERELSIMDGHDILDEADAVEQTVPELSDRTGSSRRKWPLHPAIC